MAVHLQTLTTITVPPCERNNGGCDHTCVPGEGQAFECVCRQGFKLGADKVSCEEGGCITDFIFYFLFFLKSYFSTQPRLSAPTMRIKSV